MSVGLEAHKDTSHADIFKEARGRGVKYAKPTTRNTNEPIVGDQVNLSSGTKSRKPQRSSTAAPKREREVKNSNSVAVSVVKEEAQFPGTRGPQSVNRKRPPSKAAATRNRKWTDLDAPGKLAQDKVKL